MGRPPKHTADDFVDAAVTLFARGGVRAVTLAAVADATGAANGSVYHRFPDRAALLAAVWQRTSSRFEAGYREQLGLPTVAGAIAAAEWSITWCRDHVPDAHVLVAGARTFDVGDDDGARVRRELARLVRAVAAESGADADQVGFVMIELPMAVVRRCVQAGRAPGRRDADLVRGLATLVLSQRR